MTLYGIKDGDLTFINSIKFIYEADMQKLVEDNIEKLFNLKFIETQFTIKNFRIDTLAYDPET